MKTSASNDSSELVVLSTRVVADGRAGPASFHLRDGVIAGIGKPAPPTGRLLTRGQT
ncbi:MAG: hypothetical protein ACE5KX_05325 [Acidimicrobiia bacterium]